MPPPSTATFADTIPAAPPKPEWLEHLGVLSLLPGDVIVLKPARPLDMAHQAEICRMAREMFPDNGMLILEPGMELGVLDRSKAETGT